MSDGYRFRVIVLAAWLFGQYPVPSLASPPPASSAEELGVEQTRTENAITATVKYVWEDPNTAKVMERRGDTLVVDSSRPARQLSHTVTIDLGRLRRAVSSFGIPESWLTISYRTAEERRRKELERNRKARERGIAYDEQSDSMLVAYDWVVENSRDDVAPVARGLTDVARDSGYKELRGFLGVIASYVQALEYRVPGMTRQARDGTTLYTGGVTMPLETLYNGWGDCDTKSLLFASMLANLRGTGVIFLHGNNHVFVGIRGTPRQYDRYVKVQGINYILAELTAPWPLGMLPEEHWRGAQRNLFRIIPIR